MLSRRALPQLQPLRHAVCGGSTSTTRLSVARHGAMTHGAQFRDLRNPTPYLRKQLAPFSTARSSSGTGRLFRSGLLAALALAFGAFGGVVVGWGYNTWLYAKWGIETAKQGRNVASRPEIDVSFFTQESVKDATVLRDGWQEVDPKDFIGEKERDKTEIRQRRGKHLTRELLEADKQELTTRAYTNKDKGATLLVFVADYGVEGWPRVVHGGVTTSLIYDALKLHAKHYPDQLMSDHMQVDLNYRRPIDTKKTYVVVLQSRPLDATNPAPAGPHVAHTIDVKVQEMRHYADNSAPKSPRSPSNLEGTAVVFLSSPEQPGLFDGMFALIGGKSARQFDTWIEEHNESWHERQQAKLRTKPHKAEK